MTDFEFTLSGIQSFPLFHKLGLFEDSPYETCGNEYFKLCTWKNEENDEQSDISIFYYS